MFYFRVRHAVAAATVLLLAACGGGGDDGGTNPPPVGDFTLTLSSPTLSVVQGATASITATIARTGSFAGTVDLTLENLPTGVSANFSPSSITAGTTSTTLTVSTFATVAPGNYTFTIRGRATGITDKTAQATLTVTAAPSIALALTPTAGSVVQGNSTAIATNLTRTNFTGAVTLAVTGAPTGVTTTVATTGDAGTITVNVGATAAPGAYTLTVTASATGVSPAVATYALMVTATPVGSFALALSPAALTVVQGANGQTAVNITRTNFNAPIALTVTGAPNGVTTAFAQSTLNTESTTTLTVSVGAAVAAGNYPLTVTATSGATTLSAVLTLTVDLARSMTLTPNPTTVSVAAGTSGATTITITRTGFTGDVTLAVGGQPAGVSVNTSPTPTAGNTSTVTFNVGAGVTPGNYPITITGTATNVPNATAQVTLAVTASASSIALSLTRPALTIEQGASDGTSIVITRTNYTGQVNLAVTGAPVGVTPTLGQSSTLTNGTTLTVAVGAGVPVGNYQLIVTGTGTGLTAATTTLALTVTAATAGSGNVTWTFGFCGTGDQPVWLAAQNGTGAWQRVVPTGNSYSFTITNFGGVAYVTQNGANDYDVNFAFGSLAELQGRGTTVCPTTTTKTVNGTVAGYGTSTTAAISLGGASASINSPVTNFTLNGVSSGAVDLVATRGAFNIMNPLAGVQVNKLIIRRNLNPANGSTLPVLDFNAAEAFDPDQKVLTINGAAGGEQVFGGVTYFTANQGFAVLTSGILATGNSVTYPAVPSAQQVATDLHVVSAFGTTVSGTTNTSSRILSSVFKDAGNRTVTLPSELATPTFSTLASAPYLRTRVQLARQTEYDDYWTLGYSQTGRSVVISYTAAYLGANAIDFNFPDFSALAGWQNVWAPVTGALTTWNVSASGWTLGGGGFVNPYIEGTVISTAARTGQFTP